jgi:nuclear RNA export factor
MIQQPTTIPNPLRAPRGTRTSRSPQPLLSRGGIQKRNGGPPRVDRDGDLDMDGASGSTRGRGRGGRGGRGRGLGPTGPRNFHGRGLLDPNIDQKIAFSVASGTAQVRDRRGETRVGSALAEATGERRNRDLRTPHLQTITVRGWTQSKAASNQDGGIKDLLAFLVRKASPKDSTQSEMVRIEKVCSSSQSAGHKRCRRLSNYTLTGLLSLQANSSERRPRCSIFAATAYG